MRGRREKRNSWGEINDVHAGNVYCNTPIIRVHEDDPVNR